MAEKVDFPGGNPIWENSTQNTAHLGTKLEPIRAKIRVGKAFLAPVA